MSVKLDRTMYRLGSGGRLHIAVGRPLYVLETNGALDRVIDPNDVAATETLVEGFHDEALTSSAGTGPFTSNADGQFDVWFPAGSYDLYAPTDTTNPITRWQTVVASADISALEADVAALEADGGPVKKAMAQANEETFVPVFDVDPKSTTAPKFSLYVNSAENTGEAAGTYNRGSWMGFNAGRYLGGTFETGKQGVYMGFEDNYYDNGGDETYGVEWYVGYTTPDGSTIGPAELRPFYFRVKESETNAADKEVIAWVDVGAGTGGNFSVMGSVLTGTELFIVHKSLGIFNRLPAYFTADNADAGGAGTVQIAPADGYAQLDIVAPGVGVGGGYGIVAFKDVDTYRWTVQGTTGSFEIKDTTNGRVQLQLIPGTTVNGSAFIVSSAMRCDGAVGFNGVVAAGKQTLGAAATDPATTQTLANNLRAALIAFGLGQT